MEQILFRERKANEVRNMIRARRRDPQNEPQGRGDDTLYGMSEIPWMDLDKLKGHGQPSEVWSAEKRAPPDSRCQSSSRVSLTISPFSRSMRHMNVSDLARRLRVTPHDLLQKLPELGFDIGGRAIKVDDRMGEKIAQAWSSYERQERMKSEMRAASAKLTTENGVVVLKDVRLPQTVVVRDFAGLLKLPVTTVIRALMKDGILAAQNERLDFETAAIIAEELGFKAMPEEKKNDVDVVMASGDHMKELIDAEKMEDRVPRPPVVVIMGHVDHGKTKTLDAIRQTDVMAREAGGITQHIGAYQTTKKDRKITFIDTPGHEAFTVMRSRGARVADIAVLIVAAEDGVKPQTIEALNIIKAAKLPFIVGMNKIDKPEADPEKVLAQLSEQGVTTDAWGGPVPLIKMSAKTGLGIDELLDMILFVADVNADKITANPNRLAAGTVIESHVDKGEGPVATILVQTGTLKRNDYLGIAGAGYGRVRAMRDWNGKALDEAPPGTPIKVLGFKVAPAVGDIIEVPVDPSKLEAKKMKTSRDVAGGLSATKTVQTEAEKQTKKVTLNVVLKCDVLGSLEALLGMFEKIVSDDAGVEVIQKGLGNITEADVTRAENATPSVVYGFNVVPTPQASLRARDKHVEIKQEKIIYDVVDDVIARLDAMLPPEIIVTPLGQFETVAIFRTESGRMVIGGKVREGRVASGEKARVWRGEDPIGEGVIESVQAGKMAVKDVMAGQECGLSFKGKVKIQVGDRLEVFHEEIKKKKIEVRK